MENWKSIQTQIAQRENLTSYNEPQAYLELPNDCSLEITHEEFGLSEVEQYYSWRVHCSEEDFNNNKYYSSCGIVAQSVSETIEEETCVKMLAWAEEEARKTMTAPAVTQSSWETTVTLTDEEVQSLADAVGIDIRDSDSLKQAVTQALNTYVESIEKTPSKGKAR